MKTTENERMHQLNTMVLTDNSGVPAWPIYPFTETPDNEESVLLRSAELLTECEEHFSVHPILLLDNLGESEPGYLGAQRWENRLRNLGVKKSSIVLVPFREPLLHTLSEAFAVVQFAKEKKWRELFIIAPPFHQLRCLLSMVTAVNHLNPEGLRVYNRFGYTQPWDEHAVHSQKVVQGKRKDLIIGELRRIEKYQKEGTPVSLASTDEALEYLEWRDS